MASTGEDYCGHSIGGRCSRSGRDTAAVLTCYVHISWADVKMVSRDQLPFSISAGINVMKTHTSIRDSRDLSMDSRYSTKNLVDYRSVEGQGI